MPKITDMQIQKKNKTRANVYLDGEYAFALEMLTVMKLGLSKGKFTRCRQTYANAYPNDNSRIILRCNYSYCSAYV